MKLSVSGKVVRQKDSVSEAASERDRRTVSVSQRRKREVSHLLEWWSCQLELSISVESVAQSTSKAELYALVEAVNELNMLRNFLIEIGEDQRTSKCYEDNKEVLDWANNQSSNSRLKTLEITDDVV